METLDQIGRRFGTDQSSLFHDYLRVFEPYFEPYRHRAITFLEIGILGGASLAVWREYFKQATILGMDYSPAAIKSAMDCGIPQVDLFLADSSTEEGWRLLKGSNPTIVTDDASHCVWASYQAFKLGWPLLMSGGLWIISDTHASFDPAYRRDNERNGLPEAVTIMDVIFRECGRRLHEFGDSQTGRFTTVESDIESVTYTKSLIILRKRSTKGAEQ